VSLRLIDKLQQADHGGLWDNHPDLLLWLIYMGGAFLPIGSTRTIYLAILNQKYAGSSVSLPRSWPQVLETLKTFVWPERVFTSQIKAFWEESSI
jgi:hypothetical protein